MNLRLAAPPWIRFLPLLGLAVALPCAGAEPLSAVLACRAITDTTARLACFDRETAALAAQTIPAGAATAATATTAAIAAAPAPPLDAQQRFGLSDGAIAAKETAAAIRLPKETKLQAHVAGLSLTGNGRTLFTLDNAQVWQQLESDGDMLARLGDSVTISRAALGSYWLQLKSGRGCRVTRLR